MDIHWWAWAAVVAFIVAALLVDLLVFHRHAHTVSTREAALASAVWIAFGLIFGVIVFTTLGSKAGGEYFAGYLIEKSLSVDNIFVFALIFSYFAVPPQYQHRVLFWGVLGALVFRAIFIALGAALLENFHFMIYVFGGFLVFTGLRMIRHDTEVHPERNPVLNLMRRAIPITSEYHGQKFFIRQNLKRYATPLLAVLVVVETSDILFAVDSIPAIFAVTDEPFIVFTSNAFAILGLRALYFLLAGAMGRFHYLKFGLAAVLVWVGFKMLVSEVWHVNIWLSLAIIATLITVSIVVSLMRPPSGEEEEEIAEHAGEGLAARSSDAGPEDRRG